MRSLSVFMGMLCSAAVLASSIDMNVASDAKTFSIRLPANPTTGYRWVIDSFDETHFQKTAEKYLPSAPKRIGSGGEMCFTFKKTEPATPSLKETTFVFKYQRGWEEKPVDVKTVIVHFNTEK